VLALGYLLAELWHGPSRVGWTLARLVAALAIVGAPLLWLFRKPLCAISGVESVNPGAQACGDTVSRSLPVSEQGFAAVLVLLVGAGVLIWVTRISSGRSPGSDRSRIRRPEVTVLLVVGLTLVGLLVVSQVLSAQESSALEVGSEHLALAALLLLAIPATMALRARDPRRFAVGMLLAAIVFFVAWYPNLSGLPLPSDFANIYQGLLPTWNHSFQFAVNRDPAAEGSMVDALTIAAAVVTVILGLVVMILARYWGTARPARTPVAGETA